jgi:hypothetical protein
MASALALVAVLSMMARVTPLNADAVQAAHQASVGQAGRGRAAAPRARMRETPTHGDGASSESGGGVTREVWDNTVMAGPTASVSTASLLSGSWTQAGAMSALWTGSINASESCA